MPNTAVDGFTGAWSHIVVNPAMTLDTPTLRVLDVEIGRKERGPLSALDGPLVSVEACGAADDVIRVLDRDCPDAVIVTVGSEADAAASGGSSASRGTAGTSTRSASRRA